MSKETMITRASSDSIADKLGLLEENRIAYAMSMLALQEKAGLTYKEARAHLIPYRETTVSMAAELDMDVHSIYNLQRKARKKIETSGMTEEEIYGDRPPVSVGTILVSPVTPKHLIPP